MTLMKYPHIYNPHITNNYYFIDSLHSLSHNFGARMKKIPSQNSIVNVLNIILVPGEKICKILDYLENNKGTDGYIFV